uniref:Ras-associating domain-containing protein n=1 Tax=Ciona savignyi TaxID=51511 RepID=H2Y3V5_CIOSA
MMEMALGKDHNIPMEDFQSRLNDYNTYYTGSLEQLRQRQTNNGELVVDGFLSIYWGLRTAIRLQVTDDDAKLRPKTIVGSTRQATKAARTRTLPHTDGTNGNSVLESLDIESGIWGNTRQRKSIERSKVIKRKPSIPEDEKLNLARINSVVMRKKISKYPAHRGSINGHLFNQKTSVFTPAFGSVTKVRITSRSNAHDVIAKLLSKFKVLNPPSDFSLYVVKDTHERRELSSDEFPLVARILIGPNERLGKIYIIEKKRH